MTRVELILLVKAGKNVIIALKDAEVLSVKRTHKFFNSCRRGYLIGVLVDDPTYGKVWFGSFSRSFSKIQRGNKVSLKVKVTGIGDPTNKYPDPLLFSKPLTRGKNSVIINDNGNRNQNITLTS